MVFSSKTTTRTTTMALVRSAVLRYLITLNENIWWSSTSMEFEGGGASHFSNISPRLAFDASQAAVFTLIHSRDRPEA